jgi:hypothetical protein
VATPRTLGQAGDEAHDLGAALVVQGAGRIVDEQHLGAVHETASEGDALPLPAESWFGRRSAHTATWSSPSGQVTVTLHRSIIGCSRVR